MGLSPHFTGGAQVQAFLYENVTGDRPGDLNVAGAHRGRQRCVLGNDNSAAAVDLTFKRPFYTQILFGTERAGKVGLRPHNRVGCSFFRRRLRPLRTGLLRLLTSVGERRVFSAVPTHLSASPLIRFVRLGRNVFLRQQGFPGNRGWNLNRWRFRRRQFRGRRFRQNRRRRLARGRFRRR